MDVHREHLYAMLAKAAKATHTCQEAILSSVGGEKKLQTQTPTRKHQTGFQGWWPHHTTDHIMPLSKDIMAVSFPFSSLTHEPLKERTPVEETYTCAKSHL